MTKPSFSRREFLKYLGVGSAGLLLPQGIYAAPSGPPPRLRRLAENLNTLVDNLEIGLDIRRMNRDTGDEYWRIQINADELYPVASCFKSFLILYYFWTLPQEDWFYQEGSWVYSTIVFSNNMTTSYIMNQVGEYIDVFGNAVQKFNDFLLFTLGMQNGLYSWNWPNSPTAGMVDRRFEASERRSVNIRGTPYRMDNLTTTAELADGYALMLQPDPFLDVPQSRLAIETTLALCSIPANNYQAPIERAFRTNYTGKDGVLPASDSVIGRVINDAGIVEINDTTYVIAFMCAGEGEFVGLNILAEIASLLREYEASL